MGFELVTACRMEEFKPLSYSESMRLTMGLPAALDALVLDDSLLRFALSKSIILHEVKR